ncbi:MAG TPA: MBL fold metallo-hydrolase [Myxococcaceae bacterium]|jgi:phosphoribosyl 1,2-cyclic phosphodiesterase/DNA-binding response OmpR family regulator
MRVRFWGTRGSVPKPGPLTVRYGGNTSCVEVMAAGGTRLVLDCGTGAHGLGQTLVNAKEQPIRGHMLIGHTHWDHIQGFPFFSPLFTQGNEWDVYAPLGLGQHLEKTLAGQMQHTYFPVSLQQLGATIRFHDLVEGNFQAGAFRVTSRYLNHPAMTLGYRLEVDGGTLVYATDHEPHSPEHAGGGHIDRHQEDRRHAEFISGADVLIHDAQYTAEEYPAKMGWGHSTVEYVVDVALAAKVRTLYLFHHDPSRTDDQLDALVEACRQRVARSGQPLEVHAAAEGTSFEVGRSEKPPGRKSAELKNLASHQALASKTIVIALGDPAEDAIVGQALESEGFTLVRPEAGGSLLEQIASLRPALVLLDEAYREGEHAALTMVMALRAHPDALLRDLPVVMVRHGGAGTPEDFRAGASDVLTAPFSTPYVRARARAWLMRTQTRWLAAPPPPDELARLDALRRMKILDTPPDERFDRITRLAAQALDVPYAAIGLMDAHREWFKSRHGFPLAEVPRDTSLCAYTILEKSAFSVDDMFEDHRFADMPTVSDAPHMRFYAGVSLKEPGGHPVGALCVMDTRPRRLNTEELQSLQDLAALAQEALRR